ncbi:hypothetical protein SUGI_1175580 [Cryptomeria japonica]|uniref:1-aminocyclopropane-1-carboxylate oxidase 5 n=1 Tax=Cryptomeria japonica TaxID=3369 RepID=UPI002414CD05|nr:1-aminocyclopropane-1-carboxylate oxidase 5 [Cryptomeria japonica]GLJ54727.1 hypothetical protein SUGI_1175580 [Cryptomeria japonica]
MGVVRAENSAALKFEESFIQSEEHRPNRFPVSPDDINVKIPVIDLEKSCAEDVEKACREWGFFHLVNHGFPDHLLHRLKSAAADFFSLPLEEKRRVSRDARNPYGYFDSELTKNVRDWKEVFDFALWEDIQLPTSVDPHDTHSETFTNRWPDGHPDFREACLAYIAAARELSFRLLQLISRSLGLPENRLNEYFKDDLSTVRLNSYPECPAPELTLGLGRHKDGGAVTLLYQDDVGGLQVKRKDNGQWLPAQPLPNSFVVNVGDCIQVWSNGRYESVEHRVVVNDSRRRLSIPFFLRPSHYVMMKPLEELVSEENPPKYREFNWGKFFRRRLDGNFKNLGVENQQIYHFGI